MRWFWHFCHIECSQIELSLIFTTALWSQIKVPCQIWTDSDLFLIYIIFGNEKVHLWGGSTQSFCMSPLWFFLHMASTCGEYHKRDFSSHFSTTICVPIVQIWITYIKRKENATNHLNIANEARKMPNLHNNYFMVYVDHKKNSSANNEGVSTLFQNLSGSLLKPQNFIRDGSICEHSTWQ